MDEIGQGAAKLHEVSIEMGKELKSQTVMLDDINEKTGYPFSFFHISFTVLTLVIAHRSLCILSPRWGVAAASDSGQCAVPALTLTAYVRDLRARTDVSHNKVVDLIESLNSNWKYCIMLCLFVTFLILLFLTVYT